MKLSKTETEYKDREIRKEEGGLFFSEKKKTNRKLFSSIMS